MFVTEFEIKSRNRTFTSICEYDELKTGERIGVEVEDNGNTIRRIGTVGIKGKRAFEFIADEGYNDTFTLADMVTKDVVVYRKGEADLFQQNQDFLTRPQEIELHQRTAEPKKKDKKEGGNK
ncbi:MAG: hypothetical protein PHS46_08335 [Candidatus Omnitrophica bacterium]|nr:hypothetical protein [Candidatus Omnitrophota bacterium]